jgi:FkbM family methyltransferase
MRINVGMNEVPVELFKNFQIDRVQVRVPGLDRDVVVRMGETDPEVFAQIFVRNEYKHPMLPEKARVILDAGANVGYSVLFFRRLYPAARIIAVEPDPTNFAMLRENCEHLSDVHLVHAALWNACGTLGLQFSGDAGRALGSWGVRTMAAAQPVSGLETTAVDAESLMRQFGLDRIDIFKIDIEGAEREVFSDATAAWYERVALFVLETHERFAKGSDEAVKRALQPARWQHARKGENQFFRRK